MDPKLQLQKKKVVVTAAGLAAMSGLLSLLPTMATRHHIPALWVALPLLAVEIAGFAYMMVQFAALVKLRNSLRD